MSAARHTIEDSLPTRVNGAVISFSIPTKVGSFVFWAPTSTPVVN